MSSAVIYGPVSHGVMEIVNSYALQDQLQVVNLMKHLRWRQKGANDTLITLDNMQSAAGFTHPVCEDTSRRLDYLDEGWLVSIQKRLRGT